MQNLQIRHPREIECAAVPRQDVVRGGVAVDPHNESHRVIAPHRKNRLQGHELRSAEPHGGQTVRGFPEQLRAFAGFRLLGIVAVAADVAPHPDRPIGNHHPGVGAKMEQRASGNLRTEHCGPNHQKKHGTEHGRGNRMEYRTEHCAPCGFGCDVIVMNGRLVNSAAPATAPPPPPQTLSSREQFAPRR